MVFFSEAGVVWLSSGTRRIMDKRVVRKYSAISINSKARIIDTPVVGKYSAVSINNKTRTMDTRVADIYVKGRIYAINKIAMLTGDNIK